MQAVFRAHPTTVKLYIQKLALSLVGLSNYCQLVLSLMLQQEVN